MTWTSLLASKAQKHKTSKKELDNMLAPDRPRPRRRESCLGTQPCKDLRQYPDLHLKQRHTHIRGTYPHQPPSATGRTRVSYHAQNQRGRQKKSSASSNIGSHCDTYGCDGQPTNSVGSNRGGFAFGRVAQNSLMS